MKTELLNKYNMQTLDEYKIVFGDTKDTEINFYQTFLIQTDYISNKLIEAQFLNIACDNYIEELEAREYCRQQIRRLTGQEAKL